MWVCVDNVTQVYSKMTKEGILLKCDYELLSLQQHLLHTTKKEMNIIWKTRVHFDMDACYIITICCVSR